MNLRKILSIAIVVCLLATQVATVAWAQEVPAQTLETIAESAEQKETKAETEAVPEVTAEENKETEDVKAEEAEAPADIVLTAELDDVIVTLKADADAFENKGELSLVVKPVEIEDTEEEAALDAVEKENVAKRVTYDITVLDDGEKIEPVKEVKVSFELKDAPSGADGVNIYHHDEEEGIEKIATQVLKDDAKEETAKVSEIKTEKTAEKDVEFNEVSEEELADTDDVEIIDDVTVDGFSLYTVDFTYKDKTISIAGDSTGNKLDDIVSQLGIEEKVEEATAYQDEECTEEADNNEVKSDDGETLYSVYEEGDTWYVDAVNAFQTEHGLIVKTADGAEYKIKVTDDQTATNVKYIDAEGKEQTCASATVVSASASRVTWNAGWYVVNSQVTITGGADCNGTVNLILADDGELTITGVENYKAGIGVTGGSKFLTIYGQNDQSGKLTVTGGNLGAGIGGGNGESGSNITINGGIVNANSKLSGSAIGGGKGAAGSNITINGGIVNAKAESYGTGIGGGAYGGNGSNITINGGTVTASGSSGGAGIGNGNDCDTPASNIKAATEEIVKAGTNAGSATEITHTSTDDIASNLAGKAYVKIEPKVFDKVEYIDADGTTKYIGSDSTVSKKYTIISDSNKPTAWNAGWYVVDGGTTDAPITIPGAIVNGAVHLILKDGCNLKVTGASEKAGICVQGSDNSFKVYAQSTNDSIAGTLSATGGTGGGAGIGGDREETGNNITINGGNVTATSQDTGAGIGGGNSGAGSSITINGGNVTATSQNTGAGIGGGAAGNGNNIIINGGTVIATSKGSGAGIGGGSCKSGSNITINGGNVTANGGDDGGAGIGGGSGDEGVGSDITITGGTVTAIGKNGGDGIGNGNDEEYTPFSSGIKVSADLTVKAGSDAGSTIAIAHTSDDDIASNLAGKAYAKIEPKVYDTITYIDADGSTRYIGGDSAVSKKYTVLSSTNKPTTWTAGWYVVDGTVSYGINPITANGDVHLILKNGCYLFVIGNVSSAGICVSGDSNKLTIYSQSLDNTVAGKLEAEGGGSGAGIGGGSNASGNNITINGGNVTATGGNAAAGIGGGILGTGNKITINGGKVIATGGDNGGSGIGGGSCAGESNIKAAADVVVKAGDTANPTTEIAHDATTDLAGDNNFKDKRYVIIEKTYSPGPTPPGDEPTTKPSSGGGAWTSTPTSMGSATAPISNGSWVNTNGTFTYLINGEPVRNAKAWITYTGSDGKQYTGCFYFDKNGKMVTGWQLIDGVWYYFEPAAGPTQGIMYTSRTTPDGYVVDAEGRWVQA